MWIILLYPYVIALDTTQTAYASFGGAPLNKVIGAHGKRGCLISRTKHHLVGFAWFGGL
jgi:hypothetical protein